MANFIKGDVVIIPFPFSDLLGFAVPLTSSDFVSGHLPISSNIRPTRIFTADKNIIIKKAGSVNALIKNKVSRVLIKLIS